MDTPLRPKAIYEVSQQVRDKAQGEKPVKTLQKRYPSAVDTQGAWVRKAGKLRYGYKKHHVTNREGLVLGVLTRAAKVNEISNLEAVLDKTVLPQEIPLEAAKGYQSKKNELILKKRELCTTKILKFISIKN